MATNCSNEFPTTDVFYAEIDLDAALVVFISLCSLLTLACLAIFLEELIFLQKIHYTNEIKMKKIATILGLYPITIITSLISLLVPTSTFLVDLIASCYLSVCFYTFVTLTIDYFGGDEGIVQTLATDKIQTNTPPCCCCCCCCLKPITLTRSSLLFFKLLALQVAVIRPLLLFASAVMWTDGKYSRNIESGNSSYIYITVITLVSTMASMYGVIVIYHAALPHLKHHRLAIKFLSIKLMLILVNVQNGLFAILARYDIPACIGSRGPIIRGSGLHHAILILETFLLCLVARRGYRIDDSDLQLSTIHTELDATNSSRSIYAAYNACEDNEETNTVNGNSSGNGLTPS